MGIEHSEILFKIRWSGIKQRCKDPSQKGYKYYGGRGIKCLWGSYEKFKKDMYAGFLIHVRKFGYRNTTIERIDNNKSYSGANCKWATYKEQRLNKREEKSVPRHSVCILGAGCSWG